MFLFSFVFLLVSLLSNPTPFARAGTTTISSYPLAVRNPYLSTWLPGSASHDAPTAMPQFWAGQSLEWPILVRVDGTGYYLFCQPNGVANATKASQTNISFSATHTLVTLTAGAATVKLDFFSPVSPNNYIRQSLPYSYLTVNVTSSTAHSIQVFSGIDDTWSGFAGASGLGISVQKGSDGATTYWNASYSGQTLYSENNQMAAWGSIVYGSKPASNSKLTYQYATRHDAQQAFIKDGTLANTATAYASGNLFAICHDFGNVTQASATYAVGYDREHAVKFLNADYSGYYRSKYLAPHTAVPAFLADYQDAYLESLTFDARVVKAGSQLSSNYTDLLEQSTRQVYGAMEIVIPYATLDPSSALAFLKEISSNGDADTVDVIFPTFPALYLISPEWLKLMLEPYLIYLNRNTWPFQYIPHDLGTYPNITGRDGGSEDILVEVTGPFFTMLYAYQKATGANSTWLSPYISKLFTAGDWLIDNGLFPESQLSTVDAIAPTANQTGLAMSGAVGLKALGAIFGLSNYTIKGSDFGTQITANPGFGLDSAVNPTHLTYNYGKTDSWVTAFHIFPDALLGLDTFAEGVSTMEAKWYSQQYAALAGVSGGILYAGQVSFQISEWALWAGAVCDKYAPEFAIGAKSVAAQRVFVTADQYLDTNSVPMPTKFTVSGTTNIGTFINNKARPTVGSVWAWLALNGQW
ncbi:hypothetical protein FB451DRAFT_1397565 [Mycena latifolia]|nr:hypothetical protein FB451DRAFT_1397565 [Mycena latifolia]